MTQYAKKNDNIFKNRKIFFKQKKEKRFIYTYNAHTHRNMNTISICDSFLDLNVKCKCQVLAKKIEEKKWGNWRIKLLGGKHRDFFLKMGKSDFKQTIVLSTLVIQYIRMIIK